MVMRLCLLTLVGTFATAIPALCEEAAPQAPPSQSQIELFVSQASAAFRGMKPNDLRRLYYFKGTPPDLVEKTLGRCLMFARFGEYQSTSYLSLAEAQAKWTPQVLALWRGTSTVNGMTTQPNLDVIGFVTPTFQGKDNAQNTSSYPLPVGLTPEGELRLAGSIVSGKPIIQALPGPPPSITPGPVKQAEIDTLLADANKAWRQGTWRDRIALYDLRGLSQDDVNMLVKSVQQEDQSLANVSIDAIEFLAAREIDPAQDPMAAQIIASNGVGPGGRRTSLPPVGMLVVRGKSPHGEVAMGTFVGIDEQGTLRLTSSYRPTH